MRIGIVTVSYLPRLGGAVTQTILLHGYLTSRGHHVEVFCPDLTKHGQFDEGNIRVNRVHNALVRSFDGLLPRVGILLALRRAIQQRRADFDVFITPEFNIGPLSLSLTHGTRSIGIYGADLTFEFLNIRRTDQIVPYAAVTAKSFRQLGGKNFLLATALNGLQSFLFRRLDRVVALNPADLERIGRQTRRVVKIGCLLDASRISSHSAVKPAKTPRLVTIIGRAVSWKHIPESLRVAQRLKQVYPEIEVHYFGTGPLLAQIEAQFGATVTIHKDVPNHQVLDWLARSDITVNMSAYETFCITNAEAMLNRSLLLVRPLAEYADYLRGGRNCIFVEAADTCLAAVQNAFANGGVKPLLDEAQQTILTQYSIEKTGAEIERLLLETAAER